MNKKRKKPGFTMAEVLLTLGILGAILAITTPIIRNVLPDFNLFRIKKVHMALKDTINTMLNNDVQYGGGKYDFSNTGYMIVDKTKHADVEMFRSIFLKYIKTKDTIKCQAYGAGNIDCYTVVDGSVWAIPNTNFKDDDQGSVLIELSNKLGGNSLYAPITIYPEYKKDKAEKNSDEYLHDNALIYGVRRDGKIIFIEEGYNCDGQDKKTFQCIAMKEIGSKRVKKR